MPIRTLILLVLSVLFCTDSHALPANLKAGDIIFQTSKSAQSEAIQQATKFRYSHMGMILLKGSKPCVLEAAANVKCTALEEWIDRGVKKKYIIKRLADVSLLTESNIKKLESSANAFIGKPYDPTFEWSDNKIYCSELVWKVYDRALGIKLGPLTKLGDFDLRSAAVQKKMQERFKGHPPLDEKVISPAAIFMSQYLAEVENK